MGPNPTSDLVHVSMIRNYLLSYLRSLSVAGFVCYDIDAFISSNTNLGGLAAEIYTDDTHVVCVCGEKSFVTSRVRWVGEGLEI